MTKGAVQMKNPSEPSTLSTAKRPSDDSIDATKASKKKKVESSFQEERSRLQEEIPKHHIGEPD